MLKKSKTAVLTALTVMLSAFSPLVTFAENAEPVETIPDRTLTQELNDIPEIHDNEPIQTTAVSTIPDRIYTCTSVPAIEIMPEEFPLERNFDVTVNVVDSMTGEHIDGVKVHLVETETMTSNVIKRDFGTWDSSESESYIVKADHTFTDLSGLFMLTAVLEDMPEGYSLYGGSNIVDFQVDSAMEWYYAGGNYNPRTNFTIYLDKEYEKNVQAICYLIDGDTGNYVEGAEVSLSEWDENGNLGNCVEWVTTGKDESINFDYTLKSDRSRTLIQFVVDKLPEKYNAYTFCPFDEKYADANSTVLTFSVLLYEDGHDFQSTNTIMTTTTTTTALICELTTTTTTTSTVIACKACETCGDVIDVNDGVITPLGIFVCKKCRSFGLGGTTTSTTTTSYYDWTTTTTVLKKCASCGKMINAEDGINAPLAFVCKDCRASGAGGTRPQFPTESTTTSDIIYGDSNGDGEVSLADAILIMQSISNPDIYELSEQGKSNADVYNTGDGITTQDALTIQQVNINLIKITDLPVFPDIPD
ncbi:MAG: hypothetical protein HDT23_00370 [Ruminococcus sp.]|nr:hypothetical protein [Ruminococcus sp.]